MIDYVPDDGGRATAGYKGTAGDCVARALVILTGGDYKQIYRDLAQANKVKAGRPRSARNGVSKKAYESVFRDYGLVKVQLPEGPRPTLSEAHRLYGDCIVTTARHMAAMINGALRDTSDVRTYEWEDDTRERKAQGVWVLAGGTL